jgi:hypothetical protein
MPIKKTGRRPTANTTTSGKPNVRNQKQRTAKKRSASAKTKAGVKPMTQKPKGRKSSTSTKTGTKRGTSSMMKRSKPTASKSRTNQRKKY